MFVPTEAKELLLILEESRKSIPILKVFEHEAEKYKYGKEIYCDVIKKQINETFEFTNIFAYDKLKIGIDEYIALWSDPDTQEEYKALNELLEIINEYLEATPSQHPEPTKKDEANTLSDWITHSESDKIVEGIKIQYKNIGGKRLKLLLIAFQELNLLPKERFAKTFHECCKKEFNWNIKSYTAMNDYSFNDHTDSEELNEMKTFLEALKDETNSLNKLE